MKKNILTLSLIFISTISFSQNSDWTKADRNNIFEECMTATTKYKNISKEQQESISLCFLEEVTKQYSKKEYQAKIDVELNRIHRSAISLCAKNLGLDLENIQPIVEKEKIKGKINLSNFKRENIIGVWRNENSKIYLNDDTTYLIKFDSGKTKSGKWWMTDRKDIKMEGFNTFKIDSINEEEFQYLIQSGWSKPTTIFTAKRINE